MCLSVSLSLSVSQQQSNLEDDNQLCNGIHNSHQHFVVRLGELARKEAAHAVQLPSGRCGRPADQILEVSHSLQPVRPVVAPAALQHLRKRVSKRRQRLAFAAQRRAGGTRRCIGGRGGGAVRRWRLWAQDAGVNQRVGRRERESERVCEGVCEGVCVCVCACVRACVRAWTQHSFKTRRTAAENRPLDDRPLLARGSRDGDAATVDSR